MASSIIDDVLSPGDVVGEGIQLQGDAVRIVSVHPTDQSEAFAQELEVVRCLGIGSHAVVYHVREVLYRIPSEGTDSNGALISHASVEYGRDFAIKCLSKVNLDGQALAAQMTEVSTIIPQFTGQR
jgi:hypothetical protein